MTLFARPVARRVWAVLLCICCAVAFVAPVYAEAVTLTVTALAVIAAVLTACGIVCVSQPDFAGLCEQIETELVQRQINLQVKVLSGLSYVSQAAVEAIVSIANGLKAFDPVEVQTAQLGSDTLPFFGDMAVDRYYSVKSGSWRSVCTLAGVHHWQGNNYDVEVFLNDAGNLQYRGTYNGVMVGTGVIGSMYSALSIIRNTLDGYYYLGFISLDGTDNSITNFNIKARVDTPSICSDAPWTTTDSLPSISADGAIALQSSWVDNARAIDDVASLPLSIPADSVSGAVDQTQEQAQAGDKTVGLDDSVPDSQVDEFVQKTKLKYAIADYFPFCVPFDLIKGFSLLVAPAKDPVFDIPIKIPYMPEQVIHVDVTQYAGVVRIGRWFLTVMFVVALAGVTGKVIKW